MVVTTEEVSPTLPLLFIYFGFVIAGFIFLTFTFITFKENPSSRVKWYEA
jgi:hypothetical protein